MRMSDQSHANTQQQRIMRKNHKMWMIILDWGSIIAFWLCAFYFCFMGTKAKGARSFSRFAIGGILFTVFSYSVLTFGVPRYFVYDHVTPMKYQGKLVYPAVKNHLIFQSNSFNTYGVIDQSLSDFSSGDSLFLAFKIKPYVEYKSISGLKSYMNELLIFSLFLFWYFFVNKYHNAVATTHLYLKAETQPSLVNYRDFLSASEPVKYFVVKKRNRSKKAVEQLVLMYNQLLVLSLKKHLKMNDNAEVIQDIINGIESNITQAPRLKVNVDRRLKNSIEEIKEADKQVDYGSTYTLPVESELSEKYRESLVGLLNSYLPEEFVQEDSLSVSVINISVELIFSELFLYTTSDNKKALLPRNVWLINNNADNKTEQKICLRHKTLIDGKPQRSREYTTRYLANDLTNILFKGRLQQEANEISNTKLSHEEINKKLQVITSQKEQLVTKLFKEIKSEVKGQVAEEVVKEFIERNRTEVDVYIADVYNFTAENSDLLFDVGMEAFAESAFGALEGLVGEG